ncbi:hypothetical protein [Flaviaesturariibacter amylovorans]|uniref:Uncharacterized protein n=1 Tax=Flaviaesturariibacter amylovorans TaxID=1084520 RepID=A0ABP8GPE1_9BACT
MTPKKKNTASLVAQYKAGSPQIQTYTHPSLAKAEAPAPLLETIAFACHNKEAAKIRLRYLPGIVGITETEAGLSVLYEPKRCLAKLIVKTGRPSQFKPLKSKRA